MDTNHKTNHKCREYRKIFVNTNCVYLKLTLHKNYLNKYNVFNQVGLISLEFYGLPIEVKNNDFLLQDSLKQKEITDEMIDDLTQEKIRVMRSYLDEAIKVEDYDEAKRIKSNLDRLKVIGKRIHELEFQKKFYINNEDFDAAKIVKLEIERLKSTVKYTESKK